MAYKGNETINRNIIKLLSRLIKSTFNVNLDKVEIKPPDIVNILAIGTAKTVTTFKPLLK